MKHPRTRHHTAQNRPDAAGHRAARLRIVACIATIRPDPKPTRPDRSSTTCLQRAAGRIDPRPTRRRLCRRARLALHRFPDPRLDRPERDGRRALGNRLSGRELPDRQAPQAIRGDTDAQTRFPAGVTGRTADIRHPRLDGAALARNADVPDADPRQSGPGHRDRHAGRARLRRDRSCWSAAEPPPPRPSAVS